MGTVFFLKCQGTKKKKETRFSLILIILILHRASIQKYIYIYVYRRFDISVGVSFDAKRFQF